MRTWAKYNFEWTSNIRPELDDDGKILAFTPHTQYQNPQGLALNAYGEGPFCKFRISEAHHEEGVYILTLDATATYVGECLSLATRFNSGYGSISPRNCYEQGQTTICGINHLIYQAAQAGQKIELWFLRTPNRKVVQKELIEALKPLWNRKGYPAAPIKKTKAK